MLTTGFRNLLILNARKAFCQGRIYCFGLGRIDLVMEGYLSKLTTCLSAPVIRGCDPYGFFHLLK